MWMWIAAAVAQEPWHAVPEAISRPFAADELPLVTPSPTGDHLLVLTPVSYPSIADLAAPMRKLAGSRVDPTTGGPYGAAGFAHVAIRSIDGKQMDVVLPDGVRVLDAEWEPAGKHIALEVRHPDHVGLWLVGLDGHADEVSGLSLVTSVGPAWAWLPKGGLVVKRAPASRGNPPVDQAVPPGPMVRSSAGATAASTYEARDLLVTPDDDAAFAWYGTSQVTIVGFDGSISDVGVPGVHAGVRPSPDGRYLLVRRLVPPWSHRVVWSQFPSVIEVWDRSGKVVRTITQHPALEAIPIQGVQTGPRDVGWIPTAPASLVWLEALDGGDPAKKVSARDRVMRAAAPFDAPVKLLDAPHRVEGLAFGASGLVLVEQFERERRWRHVWTADLARPGTGKPWFDLSANDAYADPGRVVQTERSDGTVVIVEDKGAIFFSGQGASPEGERPFLDRRGVGSATPERLFRSEPDAYATFEGFVGGDPKRFFVRREDPQHPPNWSLATLGAPVKAAKAGEARVTHKEKPLTSFADPQPELRGISKEIVTYTRKDGVPLSFTLYLPPGYQAGTRLPTVLYAYPREYSDPSTAGQVTTSEARFTRMRGPSVMWFLLQGYAVLADTAMPVLGDPDTAYDTFVQQIVMDAEAAVAEAVRRGVTDPDRIGVMGHSHGALMVATLLAHSDLFRAGIARSGAYNHTIRPFGYQNERRTLWQAKDSYLAMSPVMFAPQINEPLLLVHGAQDPNPGTVPLQSERLFEAVRGVGGTVRLVMLPFEGHSYTAKESVEHVLWEQATWFDTYVKNAPKR